jgi:hypothetical protein
VKKVIQFSLIILILIAPKKNVGQHQNGESFTVKNNLKTDCSTQKTKSFNEKATDIFVSSNLPIVIIDTNNQNIMNVERIVANMGIIYHKDEKRNYLWHPYNNYNGRISIEVRGWSSTQYPKKQYAFETQDYRGENLNVSLLDLPQENDWILYAPYSDKSLMRNVLAYKLARDMGRYASRTVFCELVLNDQYWGIYVLMEKIKRDTYRVDISQLNPYEINGTDLTGGYIIKLDKTTDSVIEGWRSS